MKFKIAKTKSFLKIKIDKKIQEKLENEVYPKLQENPFFGPNIKKLKGEFKDIELGILGCFM